MPFGRVRTLPRGRDTRRHDVPIPSVGDSDVLEQAEFRQHGPRRAKICERRLRHTGELFHGNGSHIGVGSPGRVRVLKAILGEVGRVCSLSSQAMKASAASAFDGFLRIPTPDTMSTLPASPASAKLWLRSATTLFVEPMQVVVIHPPERDGALIGRSHLG